MTIESGTTKDRRNRIVIFVVMCLVFAGWFAHDGFNKYPAKNIKWARQSLQRVGTLPDPKDLTANPKAIIKNLEQIKSGMSLAEVKTLLGEPTFQEGKDYCYIGLASYGWFKIAADNVITVEDVKENTEPSESDIRNQKYFALVAALTALVSLGYLIRIMRVRYVLDDAGLAIRGKKIAYEDMIGLATGDYERKGWLDLKCRVGSAESFVRLDSYLIDRFDEIVNAICEKKGFQSPIKSPEAEDM